MNKVYIARALSNQPAVQWHTQPTKQSQCVSRVSNFGVCPNQQNARHIWQRQNVFALWLGPVFQFLVIRHSSKFAQEKRTVRMVRKINNWKDRLKRKVKESRRRFEQSSGAIPLGLLSSFDASPISVCQIFFCLLPLSIWCLPPCVGWKNLIERADVLSPCKRFTSHISLCLGLFSCCRSLARSLSFCLSLVCLSLFLLR